MDQAKIKILESIFYTKHMYFESRTEAGRLLAGKLMNYRYENVCVLALNEGGVLVGREIAASLHCALTMMVVSKIDVPGESQTFGTMSHSGGFLANKEFSDGQIEEYYAEFHGLIDQQKQEEFRKMNRVLAGGGLAGRAMLQSQVVVLVADGMKDSELLHAAAEFLKPVKLQRIIVATPIASVPVVDTMHIMADEIQCLGVASNYLDTNHYFDINDVPDHERIVEMIEHNVLYWR